MSCKKDNITHWIWKLIQLISWKASELKAKWKIFLIMEAARNELKMGSEN